MAVTIRVDDDRAGSVNLVVSALAELGAALHVLAEPGHHGGLVTWAERIRATMDDELTTEYVALRFLWHSYRANFLVALTGGQFRDLDDELAEVAALPTDRFVEEAIQPLRAGQDRDWVRGALDRPDVHDRVRTYARSRSAQTQQVVDDLFTDPEVVRGRIVRFLERCAEAFFADEWRQIRPVLLADAQEKSDLIRLHGVHAALAELGPGIRTDRAAGRAVIDKTVADDIDVGAQPLQLVPSVLGWPHMLVQSDPDWPASVQYPVRRGHPRDQPPTLERTEQRLSALADPSRLSLCELITREGRSTQELADMTGMTAPTVSRHLQVLRQTGLVTTQRRGHFLLYQLDTDIVSGIGHNLLASLLR